jgi:hypothetical protein
MLQITEYAKQGKPASFIKQHFTQVYVLRSTTLIKVIRHHMAVFCNNEAIIHMQVKKMFL